jgi:hypothetical protein
MSAQGAIGVQIVPRLAIRTNNLPTIIIHLMENGKISSEARENFWTVEAILNLFKIKSY